MSIKSSGLSRAFFPDGPPYYEHEVLENLEEFNLKADANSLSDNNNFAKVLSGLDKSADSIISTITDESERSRIQAQINSERIEAGISETNYHLLDLSSGINSLDDSLRESNYSLEEQVRESSYELGIQIRESSDAIQEQIYQTGVNIVHQLEITSGKLYSIDNNLLAINDSLKGIGSILSIILERINKPNEVQAIELADQIRISLAIGKHEEALRVTRKAMELCSTSITVTAYHLMTLSLFDVEELKKESKAVYKDFVNLINFKLFDSGSDTKSVRDEIYYVAYPALFALSRSLGGIVLEDTERLYASISGDKTATKMLLMKPLEDKSTEIMTLHPSPLRELHWTVILTEEIVSNKSFEKLPRYIVKLASNNVLIKNELLIKANKELYNSKILHSLLMKTWYKDNATVEELSCLDIFISMQPAHNIKMNDRTLLLVNNYINKRELIVGRQLKEILSLFEVNLKKDSINEHLFKTKKLHTLLDKTWYEDSASIEELDTLSTFVLMQPQQNIKLDDKTIILIDRYASKYKLPISENLKKANSSVNSKLNEEISFYKNNWKKIKTKIIADERNNFSEFNKIANMNQSEEVKLIDKYKNKVLEYSKIDKPLEYIRSLDVQKEELYSKIKTLREIKPLDKDSIAGWLTFLFVVLVIGIAIYDKASDGGIVGFFGGILGGLAGIIMAIVLGIPFYYSSRLLLLPLLELIYGHSPSVVKSKISNIEENIGSINDQIDKVNEQVGYIQNLNERKEASLNKASQNTYDSLIKCAIKTVSTPAENYVFSLKKDFEAIKNKFFFVNKAPEKASKEMKSLCLGYLASDIKLSSDFQDKFISLKSKFNNSNSERVNLTISEKLLFNEKITEDELEKMIK